MYECSECGNKFRAGVRNMEEISIKGVAERIKNIEGEFLNTLKNLREKLKTLETERSNLLVEIDGLKKMAEAYGEQGRAAYIRARFTFDLIWPLVYGFFLVTAISWVFARGFPPESRWRWANLAPILGMLFDYLENISTSLVMFRYPATTPIVAWLAPFFTTVKWIFVNGSFVLLVIGVVAALWRSVQKKTK